MDYQIIRLTDQPEIKEQAALWFHQKWKIPFEAYMESMEDCLLQKSPIPQWYVAMEGNRIIGGLGVIENDFHSRKDLTPNVCAVYTEEDRRCKGVAGALLSYVCGDMKNKGIAKLNYPIKYAVMPIHPVGDYDGEKTLAYVPAKCYLIKKTEEFFQNGTSKLSYEVVFTWNHAEKQENIIPSYMYDLI